MIIDLLWLKQQFDRLELEHQKLLANTNGLHEEHALILKQIGATNQFRFDYKVGPIVTKKPKGKTHVGSKHNK